MERLSAGRHEMNSRDKRGAQFDVWTNLTKTKSAVHDRLLHRWQFLTPVQKSGSPIPREALARRCARDEGLLRFVCSSARRSAALASAASTERSGLDSTVTVSGRAKLFSFYAAIVVETLDTMGSTRERVLRAILPDIVHGLSAVESSEYQVGSYCTLSNSVNQC